MKKVLQNTKKISNEDDIFKWPLSESVGDVPKGMVIVVLIVQYRIDNTSFMEM